MLEIECNHHIPLYSDISADIVVFVFDSFLVALFSNVFFDGFSDALCEEDALSDSVLASDFSFFACEEGVSLSVKDRSPNCTVKSALVARTKRRLTRKSRSINEH